MNNANFIMFYVAFAVSLWIAEVDRKSSKLFFARKLRESSNIYLLQDLLHLIVLPHESCKCFITIVEILICSLKVFGFSVATMF